MERIRLGGRTLSILSFSFLFAYILSFLFEGQVLYGLLEDAGADAQSYILTAMVAHFLGQLTGGFFCRSVRGAKSATLLCIALLVPLTTVFLIENLLLWRILLAVGGYLAGCAVAAWGFFLREYTPKNERIRTCADVLIYANLMMIAVNVAAVNLSARLGLILSVCLLIAGGVFASLLPAGSPVKEEAARPDGNLKKPMGVLFLFVAVITVDSGLMYQVVNPAFRHLSFLQSWYWAVPYIASLAVMRNLPVRLNRPAFLYAGMGMIMAAFLSFMLLGRGRLSHRGYADAGRLRYIRSILVEHPGRNG